MNGRWQGVQSAWNWLFRKSAGVACGGRVWVPGPLDEKQGSASIGGRRGACYLTFLKSQFPHLKSEVDSVTGLLWDKNEMSISWQDNF